MRLPARSEEHLSDTHPSDQDTNDDRAPEYDFSRGAHGKYVKAMRTGYTIVIHKSDGATEAREALAVVRGRALP